MQKLTVRSTKKSDLSHRRSSTTREQKKRESRGGGKVEEFNMRI